MKDKKVIGKILSIIVVYIVVGIVLPFIFKYMIFENRTFSNLSNNEWAGFLGSYVGGILGGLGTLISVYITVKDSRNMQAENKRDTDQKIMDDKEEREKERKEYKGLEEQKERRQFADDIAIYVGKYITHISKYYYASRWAEDIDLRFRDTNDKLKQLEREIMELNKKISKLEIDSEEISELEIYKTNLLEEKKIMERKYNEQLKEKEKNSIEGNRTKANECYFILKTKLCNISEANDLLSQLDMLHKDMFKYLKYDVNDWIGENSELLMKEYNKFKTKYVIKETNNIPKTFDEDKENVRLKNN